MLPKVQTNWKSESNLPEILESDQTGIPSSNIKVVR